MGCTATSAAPRCRNGTGSRAGATMTVNSMHAPRSHMMLRRRLRSRSCINPAVATARHLSLNLDLPPTISRVPSTANRRQLATVEQQLDFFTDPSMPKRISTRSLGRFVRPSAPSLRPGKAPKCAKKGGEKELNLDWELAAGGNRWWARDLARENPEEFKLEWPAYAHLVDDL
ncbi:hypothetical protein B0H14DRAFT_3879904 [Mycena olivaceomarginata]|nr:hypothetical protein B0H14DRAFT_3879904 [Mycena olivaceomarginata]